MTEVATVGHNSNQRIKAFIDRIERLEQEKSDLAADIREIYMEAKGAGLDTKVLRVVIRRRKMDAAARAEMDNLVETYEGVLS